MPRSAAGSARTNPAARVPRQRRPLTPEQQALAARYLPLARSLARPFQDSWPDSRDEFESAACLALVEAAEAFDPDRQVKFLTFARHRIWGALADVLRRRLPLGYRDHPETAPSFLQSRFAPGARFGETAPLSWEQWTEEHGRVLAVEPDPPVGSELEAIEAVERWLRKVPSRHAAALRRIYLHGETHARAAAALGCSASRVAFMHREALAMLRESADG